MMSPVTLIDLNEEDLDYEMEEMDEEALLEEDNEVLPGSENELMIDMSRTIVTPVTPTELNMIIDTTTDYCLSPTRPSNEAAVPSDTLIRKQEPEIIVSNGETVLGTVQPYKSGQKDEPETMELQTELVEQTNVVSVVNLKTTIALEESTVVNSVEMKPPETMPVSSSSPSSFKTRNKQRRVSLNEVRNSSVQLNSHRSLPSLMSIDTSEAAEWSQIHSKIRPTMNKPVSNILSPIIKRAPFIIEVQSNDSKSRDDSLSSTPTRTKSKVPLIINAQSNGLATSRKVVVNPQFDGFSNRENQSPIVRKRVRPIHYEERRTAGTATMCHTDLRNVVNKRRSITFDCNQSIPKNEEKKEPMLIENEEMSEEDVLYLKEIEKQKLKREEILRQKEWKRDNEGWQFLDD